MDEKIRKKIEEIDLKLLQLLKKRQQLVEKVALFKAKNRIPIRDKEKEFKTIKQLKKEGKKLGISPSATRRIWLEILKESRSTQKETFRQLKKK